MAYLKPIAQFCWTCGRLNATHELISGLNMLGVYCETCGPIKLAAVQAVEAKYATPAPIIG